MTATTHPTKSGAPALVNLTPEPVSNALVSLTEDALVISGAWRLVKHPILFLALLAIFIVGMLLMIRLLLRGARRLFGRPSRAAGTGSTRA